MEGKKRNNNYPKMSRLIPRRRRRGPKRSQKSPGLIESVISKSASGEEILSRKE